MQHQAEQQTPTHLQRFVSCLPVLQSCCLLSQLLKSFLGFCCMCLVGRLKLSEPRHQLVVAAAEHSLQQAAGWTEPSPVNIGATPAPLVQV